MDIQAYNEAIEFMKNKHTKEPMHQGISNLYVIRRIDKDGNVLETKFGENLMTDYGFSRHFVDKVGWPTNVYVGDGIPSGGYFSQDSKVLQNLISTTALVKSSTTKDYQCPFYYDAASSSTERGGLITVFCQYMVCYMDYSNSTYGISDPSKLIYEFGLGEDSSNLWTHSRVYTSAGAPTHVTKNNGERLEFTIFLCLSYYESMIMNQWNDSGHVDGKYGSYTVITTPERMFQRMVPTTIYTFQRDSTKNQSITFIDTATSIEETYITNTQTANSFTLETTSGDGKIKSANGYIDGFISDSPGMCIVEREEMDHLENIDMVMHPSTPYSNGMHIGFGIRDLYRFTQLEEVTSVSLFDYMTNTWVNSEVFVNDSRKWYDETPLMTAFGKPIYYMSNNTVQRLYVHQNINQLDGITAITSGNIIIYMAEKYWDTSTWVNIQDPLHIPAAYKNYKYILTGDNATDLTVKRELSEFSITPKAGTGSTDLSFEKVTGSLLLNVDNYDFGWYKGNEKVYVPDTLMTYTTSSKYSMTWDKWLVNFNENKTMTIYDMTNVVSQHPASLTSYSLTPAFGTTVSNIVSSCYRTDSNTGLICLFDKTNSQAVVVDLDSFDGTTFTTNELISGCIMACCIANTRKVAYIPSNATNTIIVYDYDTHQIYTTLTMPSLTGNPSILIGINKYVWISDSSANNTYYINIENGSYEKCDTYIPWGANSSFGNFFCSFTNNFFVGYNYTETIYSHNQAFVVRGDAPKQVKSLADMRCNNSDPSWYNLNITLRNVVTNTSDHTCAMIMSSRTYRSQQGSMNIVLDLGLWYSTGNNSIGIDNVYNDNGDNYVNNNRYGTIIPYGQFLMVDNHIKTALQYAMPHKVICKTRTITTQNNYKNISDKYWKTTFTNTPKFHGLPPGNMASL